MDQATIDNQRDKLDSLPFNQTIKLSDDIKFNELKYYFQATFVSSFILLITKKNFISSIFFVM
jgi:hypothetical protein